MSSSFLHVKAYVSTSFFLWLDNIPLFKHTTFCLFIQQLMDIWVASIVSIFSYWEYSSYEHPRFCTYVCHHLNISLEVELQGYMAILC